MSFKLKGFPKHDTSALKQRTKVPRVRDLISLEQQQAYADKLDKRRAGEREQKEEIEGAGLDRNLFGKVTGDFFGGKKSRERADFIKKLKEEEEAKEGDVEGNLTDYLVPVEKYKRHREAPPEHVVDSPDKEHVVGGVIPPGVGPNQSMYPLEYDNVLNIPGAGHMYGLGSGSFYDDMLNGQTGVVGEDIDDEVPTAQEEEKNVGTLKGRDY